MLRSFVFGAVVGGVAVWLWRDRIEACLAERTRAVRERMADRMQAMENKTGALLDTVAEPLRRAEQGLEGAKAEITAKLHAGQEVIRPAAPGDER